MKALKERNETLRRYNESSEKLDEQLRAQRKHKDPTGLGFTTQSNKETGESSGVKKGKMEKRERSTEVKGKKTFKTSCHHCGKPGHKTNDCKNALIKPITSNSYCRNCYKHGHKTSDCRSRPNSVSNGSRGSFKGYCYACNKFGHKADECRSKTMAFISPPRPIFPKRNVNRRQPTVLTVQYMAIMTPGVIHLRIEG